MSHVWDVAAFHSAAGSPPRHSPTVPSEARLEGNIKALEEEFNEVLSAIEAVRNNPSDLNFAALLKELCDLHYVTDGVAVAFGLTCVVTQAQRRVHKSNMTKFNPVTGEAHFREDGKIMKGPHYEAPNLLSLVRSLRHEG